jgi:hypothetical protein
MILVAKGKDEKEQKTAQTGLKKIYIFLFPPLLSIFWRT